MTVVKKVILGILSLLIVGSGLVGCGDTSGNGIGEFLVPGEKDLKTSLAKFVVSTDCSASGATKCSPSMGALLRKSDQKGIYGQTMYGLCSSFLYGVQNGKSIIGTNRHCVSGEDFKSKINDCTKQYPIGVKFPEVGTYRSETAMCTKVLAYSKEGIAESILVQDYAFLLLDRKINRPHLVSNQDGIPNEQDIIFPHFDPSQGSLMMTLKSSVCTPRMYTGLQANYFDAISKVFVGFGCEVEKGNSGSPVLNMNGELVGLASAKMGESESDKLSDSKKAKNTRIWGALGDLNNIIFGTNLACIDESAVGLSSRGNQNCQLPYESKKATNLALDHQIGPGLKVIYEPLARWYERFNAESMLTVSKSKKSKSSYEREYDSLFNIYPKCFNARSFRPGTVEKSFPRVKTGLAFGPKGYIKINAVFDLIKYSVNLTRASDMSATVTPLTGSGGSFKVPFCTSESGNSIYSTTDSIYDYIEKSVFFGKDGLF